MSEANYFTSSMDNDHRSACCQKHGSFSGPAACIVSYNCEGLSEAKEVLIAEMCRHHPKHGRTMIVRNYTVPSSVKGTVHAGTELIAATFENVTVTSIYKPPHAKLTFPPDFFDMNRNNISIGDFNSHNHLWGYRDDDENGLFLEEWISTNNRHLTHDSKLPNTFNSGRWKRGYNHDLACLSRNIREICQWRVYDHIPRSQHHPQGVAINPTITPSEQAFRRRYNFKKANWETFTTTLDNGITSLASPSWKAYTSVSDLVRVRARKCIPHGCQTKYISGLTPESGELLKHYQALYDADPFSEDTIEAFTNLNDHITETSKQTWEERPSHRSMETTESQSARRTLHLTRLRTNSCSTGSLAKTARYATKMLNDCLEQQQIPNVWRKAKVVALLKPGKDPESPNSYRPTALLCSLNKLLVRMILTRLQCKIEHRLIQQVSDRGNRAKPHPAD